MSIIYKTVGDEINRKSKDTEILNNYIQDLLKIYTSKDLTKNKENLLSLYFNNSSDISLLDKFLEQKYLIQYNILKPHQLDMIIHQMRKNDIIDTLPKHLNIKNHIAYTTLCMPTIYRGYLFETFHKKGQKYADENYNIIKDMFVINNIHLKNAGQFDIQFKHIQHILNTIVLDGGVEGKYLKALTDPSVIEAFFEQTDHIIPFEKAKVFLQSWQTDLESLSISSHLKDGLVQSKKKQVLL